MLSRSTLMTEVMKWIINCNNFGRMMAQMNRITYFTRICNKFKDMLLEILSFEMRSFNSYPIVPKRSMHSVSKCHSLNVGFLQIFSQILTKIKFERKQEETTMKLPALTVYQKWVPKTSTSVTLHPPPALPRNENLEVSSLQNSMYHFTPPGNEKFADLELSSPVGLQNSKYHFTLPTTPWKWKLCSFGTFKSSWTSEFQVPPPPPQKMKSWQFWNFQVKLELRF